MYYSSWANQTSFHSAQLHRWVSLKGIQNICSYLLLHWTDTSTTLNNIRCKPAGENKFICPVIALLTWTGSLAATAFRRLFQFCDNWKMIYKTFVGCAVYAALSAPFLMFRDFWAPSLSVISHLQLIYVHLQRSEAEPKYGKSIINNHFMLHSLHKYIFIITNLSICLK